MAAAVHRMPSMVREAECQKKERIGRFSFGGRFDVVRLLADASRAPISTMPGIDTYRANFRIWLADEGPTRLPVSGDNEASHFVQVLGFSCRIGIAASARPCSIGRGFQARHDSIYESLAMSKRSIRDRAAMAAGLQSQRRREIGAERLQWKS